MNPRVRRLTAPGRGAVAILSVEGPGALEAVIELAGGSAPRPGRPTLARLRSAGREFEEALVLAEGPERVELHLHGSPAVVAGVTAALTSGQGSQESSEPTPISLEQRAGAALAAAASEAAARTLLDQAEGALRRELEAILSLSDAQAAARLAALARRGRALAGVITPPRVVLGGPANAGKSTLFNVLVGRRRVVTSDEPGTTRDAVVERARLGDLAVDLVDTAGERATPAGEVGEVEAAGQTLGRTLRRSADLVLWLERADSPEASVPGGPGLDSPGPLSGGDPPRVLLASRAAAVPEALRGPYHLAALEDPEGAAAVVERAVALALRWPAEPWVPGRAVPFEAALTETLARLARARGRDQRGGLAELLAAARPGATP